VAKPGHGRQGDPARQWHEGRYRLRQGKGWNTVIRFDAPLQPRFAKTWKPGENRAGEVSAKFSPTHSQRRTMKTQRIVAALAGTLTLSSAHAQTPDSVETRLGTLSCEKGYPTPETARKLYDEMDFQRAVQAFLRLRHISHV
jgi:hypothetical protein